MTAVRRGSQLPWAKLTEADVAQIHRLVVRRNRLKRTLMGLTNAALAERFGVHPRTVEKAIAGYSWAHVVPKEELDPPVLSRRVREAREGRGSKASPAGRSQSQPAAFDHG